MRSSEIVTLASSAADLAADHAADSAADTAADLAADPAADPAADHAADLAADPAADTAADLAADTAADPAADTAADLAADSAAVCVSKVLQVGSGLPSVLSQAIDGSSLTCCRAISHQGGNSASGTTESSRARRAASLRSPCVSVMAPSVSPSTSAR
jgi:hypothetical protein